jgi:LAO/AO transport system kinase
MVKSHLVASEMKTLEAAELITRIESRPEEAEAILAGLPQKAIPLIGITGAPGVGKSTLIARLIDEYRKRGHQVGVLAVDPTSPLSGGALLGDRVRMQVHAADQSVFIRSMATRGHLGGLSRATAGAARVMAAWGADPVIIETVGVGQSETEIMELADVVAVVLTPLSGDDIQMLKAGVFEIADIFVVNKADQGRAETLAENLRSHFHRPVVVSVATEGTGVEELISEIGEQTDKKGVVE